MKLQKEPSPSLFPSPVVLVSVGIHEKPEIITVSWTGIVNSDPPMIGISVRPSRSTYNEINENKEFVVNIPTASQVREVDLCGMTSSKKIDKWDLTGFKVQKSSKIKTPGIHQCPINMECTVQQKIELGSHHLFLGEILAVHVDDEYVLENNKLDIENLKPFTFTAESYWTLGQNIGKEGFSKEATFH